MRRAPKRLSLPFPSPSSFRNRPDVDEHGRRAIFGLEREHIVIFVGADADAPRPPFELVADVALRSVLATRPHVESSGIKRGWFLENGGFVHFEVFVRHQGDTPILEIASPECRDPDTLLAYSRASDAILSEASRLSQARLGDAGYEGYVAFGKNNRDRHGTGFGTHENYLVYETTTGPRLAFFLFSLPFLLLFLVPAIIVYCVVVSTALTAVILAHLSSLVRNVGKWLHARVRQHESAWRSIVGVSYLAANTLVFPAIWLYTRVLRIVVCPRLTRELVAFLATRPIITGTGSFDLEHGVFALSQRSELLRSLSNIVIFGRGKTVFDLKAFLYRPRAVFRRVKRLVITSGDSNLSDVPNFLAIATTALVIEMIENGETFGDLALSRPLRAFRDVSLGGPDALLRLRTGERISAIDLQERFLERAKRFHTDRSESPGWARRTLELWRNMLARIRENPSGLSDTLDWVAKRSIIERLIRDRFSEASLWAWARIIGQSGAERAASSSTFDDLLAVLPPRQRRRLERGAREANLDTHDFPRARDCVLEAMKVDFRYHELSPLGGYQRMLEQHGLIERIVDAEREAAAMRDPPPDTRARVRGYWIRNARGPHSMRANWNEVEIIAQARRISLEDPFEHRLPHERDRDDDLREGAPRV
jgi:hypothetical protein